MRRCYRTKKGKQRFPDPFKFLKRARKLEDIRDRCAALLKCSPDQIKEKVKNTLENIADLEKQVASYNK